MRCHSTAENAPESGSVTAEFAAVVPAVILVLAMSLGGLQLAARHRAVLTLEENVVAGGAGSAVTELLAAEQITVPLLSSSIVHISCVRRFPSPVRRCPRSSAPST